MFSSETVHIARTCFFSLSLRGGLFLIVCRATAVARLTYDASARRGFTNASDRQHINSVIDLGLPDLPYFTGDPVFQTLCPASRGGSRREEQISRILLVRLLRHSDDTVTREDFV